MQTTILAGACYATALALGFGEPRYRISTIYVEFENVDDTEDVVTTPSVDALNPAHGVSYYLSLADSTTRDFLRLPLPALPTITVAPGWAGAFPEPGHGNTLSIFAQTAGSVGVFGRAFSSAARSKICGTALAVTPVAGDITRDIVVARGYFDSAEQIVKPANAHVGLSWEIPLFIAGG
jgi:hypothetical protein